MTIHSKSNYDRRAALPAGTGLDTRHGVTEARFEIVETLGRGGFAVTYKAIDLGSSLNQKFVAIKEFFPDYAWRDESDGKTVVCSERDRQLFQKLNNRVAKEADILKQLRHSSIVRVEALVEENDTTYIIMEFIDGISVRKFLEYVNNDGGELFNLEVFTRQVLDGLEEMHSKGIYHRDIAPDNIMLLDTHSRASIDKPIPVLIDMGAAVSTGGETTTIIYKMDYAPPEQIMDAVPAGPYTCLLYTSPSPRDGLLSRMPSSA